VQCKLAKIMCMKLVLFLVVLVANRNRRCPTICIGPQALSSCMLIIFYEEAPRAYPF
jgi:hypothetical protein